MIRLLLSISATVVFICKEKGNGNALTRDHNALNELLDTQAINEGRTLGINDYNQTGWASAHYMLTEWLEIDDDDFNPPPRTDTQTLTVEKGDCLLLCTDGIYDLVDKAEWAIIDTDTDLTRWL